LLLFLLHGGVLCSGVISSLLVAGNTINPSIRETGSVACSALGGAAGHEEAKADELFSSSGFETLGRSAQAVGECHAADVGQHPQRAKQSKWSPISLWRKEP
jgi:hypothetical protein